MQGLLSATVLSLVPLLCPFQWQSLLLPVSSLTTLLTLITTTMCIFFTNQNCYMVMEMALPFHVVLEN